MKMAISFKSSQSLLKTDQLFSLKSSKEEITRDSELEISKAYLFLSSKNNKSVEIYDLFAKRSINLTKIILIILKNSIMVNIPK